MHILSGTRRGRTLWRRRMGFAGSDVALTDHALARPEHRAIAEAVGLTDGGCRHAVFACDTLNRFAGNHRYRRAAVPGPMPGWRRTRGNRSGDIGRAGPVSAQALRAGGDAARAGDRGGPARRRQRLRFNMAAIRRARRDRAGRLLLAGVAVGSVWVGVEARAIRTTGGGHAHPV